MSNFYSLATTYYDDSPDLESQRNRLLFNGLQHFTTGTTKEQLRKLIKYSQLHKIKLDYHDTLETCILSEKTNGEPTEDLKYGHSKETVLVFQAAIAPVDALLDTDILSVETNIGNPSIAKKHDSKPVAKKTDERQPHIHVVKAQVQTIRRGRDRQTESDASTSQHTSRNHSRESSRQSTGDESTTSRRSRSSLPNLQNLFETPRKDAD
jgi:hypothetical protein